MRALIIGAGIGGLCAGIVLRREGWEVVVREQAHELSPLGAGLLLQPNARAALVGLQLDETVSGVGAAIRRGKMCSARGKVIKDMDLLFGGKRPAAIGIHRGTLQRILQDALGREHVQLGKRATAMEADGTVSFSDGSREGADVIVGADGINSVLARSMHHDLRFRYGGYTCWRGVTPAEFRAVDGTLEEGTLTEIAGSGRRFGIVPIDEGRIYWFATLNVPQGGHDEPGTVLASLRATFDGFPKPVQQILAATPLEAIIRDDIVDRIPLESWGRGNATLLGDAAHAMTPNLGQGACQAMVDALSLAARLAPSNCASPAEVPAALRGYEGERIPRTKKIVQASWNLGRMGQLENPFLRWLRDCLLQRIPTRYTERQITALLG